MAGSRRCARPACPELATATLTFQYATRRIWIDDLGPSDPHTIDLCSRHADRLSPPQGWDGLDRRASARPDDGPAALAAS